MYYDVKQFQIDLKHIADQIVASGKTYDYLVGIVRGGCIPAVYLSHRLGIPMRTVSWSTFHKEQMRECAMDIAEDVHDGKKILLVDDILDSGRTLKELFDDWGCARDKVDLSVLIYNKAQSIVPDFYGTVIDRDVSQDWVTFWWEDDAR